MTANFTKAENHFFEDVVEEFSPINLHSNQATVRQASSKFFDRNGTVERRNTEMFTSTSTGRDTTGTEADILDPTVPVGISDADIVNHKFTLNSSELKNDISRKRHVEAAIKKLSNDADLRVANKITSFGSLVLSSTGEFADYDDLAKAETELMNREVSMSDRRVMNLNPRAARKASSVLASRESGVDQKSAYEKSMLPMVAGFETHKANVIPQIAGSAATGVTVSGADQFTPVEVYDSNVSSAADNRFQNLVVNSTAALKAGDAFVLAEVNSVGGVSKSDTGSRQTFRVTNVVNGTTIQITPKIVPIDQGSTAAQLAQSAHGNVTQAPADNAALTIINTASVQPITFFCSDAVEMFTTSCADPDLGASMNVMRASTDSGIEILFAKESNLDTLEVKYRLSFMMSAHVLAPERCGIMLANQDANYGG